MRVPILILILLGAWGAHAEVLFKSVAASDIDYRSALKASEEYTPPTALYLRQHPSPLNREALLNLFTEAQKSFLSGATAEAQRRFLAIVDFVTQDDWQKTDHEVFLTASLRLAQLDSDYDQQTRWLLRSLEFGGDIQADPALFPPPLLERREELRKTSPRAQIPAQWFVDGWTVVLINGVACTADKCSAPFESSPHLRVTFLSDQWLPYTKEIKGSDFAELQPRQTAWLTGACGKSEFHKLAASVSEKKGFWGLNCEAPARKLALQPQTQVQPETLPRLEFKEKSTPLYKNKWLWMGVGLVTAAIIVSQTQKKKEEKTEPTTTYGY
jgi:hypothetical protein